VHVVSTAAVVTVGHELGVIVNRKHAGVKVTAAAREARLSTTSGAVHATAPAAAALLISARRPIRRLSSSRNRVTAALKRHVQC
jgi:hypothetical protein